MQSTVINVTALQYPGGTTETNSLASSQKYWTGFQYNFEQCIWEATKK